MRDFDAVFPEHLHLSICQPYGMRRQQIRAQKSQVLKVCHRLHTQTFFHILHFRLRLCHMHMNPDTVPVCQLFCPKQQFVSGIEDRPDPEPDLYASVRRPVKSLDILLLPVQFFFCTVLPGLRQSFPTVHDRIRQLRPDPGFFNGFCHAGHKLSARLRNRRHARLDLLRRTEQGGNIGILFRHTALIGPDPVMQPGQQVHIIRQPSCQLLGRMDMRIDQPRKDELSGQIQHLIAGVLIRRSRSRLQDPVILKQQVPVRIDLPLIIHRYDHGMLQ